MFINYLLWFLFFAFISGVAVFDLWILGRKKEELSLKEAAFWTAVWISLALFFNFLIYLFYGAEKSLDFLTAYLLEKSLSLDNLFVFLVIFSYFDLPYILQRKVLKWGILGAFLMRAFFIFGGIWLLKTFHVFIYLFGIFLVFSGVRMFFQKKERVDPQKNLFIRIVRKTVPLIEEVKEEKFFVKKEGLVYITPLFLILLLIESLDLVFALDSVPAVLSLTRDPLIAYTSNAFAVLGLRALYFFLAGFLPRFVYLKKGVMVLLIFIGLKMLFSAFFHIPTIYSLLVILAILFFSIFLSLLKNKELAAGT